MSSYTVYCSIKYLIAFVLRGLRGLRVLCVKCIRYLYVYGRIHFKRPVHRRPVYYHQRVQGLREMFSINESVTPYIDELLGREEELGVRSYYLENQSTVIDLGVEARGSLGAGMLATAIAMGGLGKVTLVPGIIDGFYLQFAQVWVDNPAIACLCSQMPGWKIKTEDFSGMAFGPARAIAQKPKNVFAAVDYVDDSETAVVLLWSQKLPSARDLDYIAKQCATVLSAWSLWSPATTPSQVPFLTAPARSSGPWPGCSSSATTCARWLPLPARCPWRR